MARLNFNNPEIQLDDSGAHEHRVRLWWTAYRLDRICASRLDLPASICDSNVEISFPSNPNLDDPSDDFADSSYLIASIRLTRLLATSTQFICASKPKQKDLLERVQESLTDIDSFTKELPPYLTSQSTKAVKLSHQSLSLKLYLNQVSDRHVLSRRSYI